MLVLTRQDDHGHYNLTRLPRERELFMSRSDFWRRRPLKPLWERLGVDKAWQFTTQLCLSPTTKTPDFVLSVAAGVSRRRELKHQILFFLFCFFFNLQLQTSHFHPPAWVQELRARPPREEKRKRFLSDVTEKKPQQCALLSAPTRGVQQPSTSTELLCLILLCRLCLSFLSKD